MIYDNVITAVDKGIITRNEARERLGLEPIDGGDDVYISANLFPLGSETPQPQQPREDETAKNIYEDAYGTKLDTYPDGEGVDPKLPNAYQLAESTYKCINCKYATYDDEEEIQMEEGIKGNKDLYCKRWEAIVRPDYWCVAWKQMPEGQSNRYSDTKAITQRKPTDAMVRNAQRALKWREEGKEGGTIIGVTRANQIVNRENLSDTTILRMFSFFSRHEVDKRATGFRQGEEGFPTAGRVAWDLWGGDEGFSWSRTKRDQIMKERDEKSSIKTNQKKDISKERISRNKQNKAEL